MFPQSYFEGVFILAFLKEGRRSMSRRLAVTSLAMVLVLGTAWAQTGNQVVEDIRIHGSRRIPAETIRARIFTRPGDVFDPAAVQRDFSSLWNTQYFEDLRIEREDGERGVILHVYVKERPTIRSIDYPGLSSASLSDVLERYKERKVGLSVESQYDPTRVKRAEVVLKELLAERGRQFATIRTEIRPIPPAAVGVTFRVTEGPKVKVGKIRFQGNKQVSGRVLRRAMRNTRPIGIPYSIFFENLFSRTFDATKLNEDAERVRDAYQQRGYFKALVSEPDTTIRDTSGSFLNPFKRGKGKVVDITMPIEEGDKFKLGSITFKNNKAVPNSEALRLLFPMKDGDTFNTAHVRKGLENLRKAYGELGYINFTSVPDTKIDDDKKLISLEVDLDEGKPFFVRRIEFQGNTTTRDKVIRRELAVEEGQVYNNRLWEISLLRLNQLDYFEQLKPEEDTEVKRHEQESTVDLTLKVKEKGKNSIGLQGSISGLAGSTIGINYTTNNFLGLGETLRIEASVGSRGHNVLLGFTEPYLFDRPLNFGVTVYTSRYDFDQLRQAEIFSGRRIDVPDNFLDAFQNFSQQATGFTVSTSYPLRRSFKRVGLTYAFETSSVEVFSEASRRIFEQLAFRSISGQDSLKGVITSKILPSFSVNTIDNPIRPRSGRSLYVGGEITGLGGNVSHIRPVVELKHFMPMKGSTVLGYRLQGSFITGYAGRVAPPFERFYIGGDNDIRGFDIRSISPIVFLTDRVDVALTNPDGTPVPKDPTNPRAGNFTVPVPVSRIALPGGDTSVVANLEYRIPIVGPVVLAPFVDFGMNMALRESQLRISDVQLNEINNTPYGCPVLNPNLTCSGGIAQTFSRNLRPVAGTNYVPRMSTGLEIQAILPVFNAPLRIYYAFNPLVMDRIIDTPTVLTRSMFPAGGAGDFSFRQSQAAFGPSYRLREPRTTFRFAVSTTF